jgi:hypothetical protein
MSRIATTPLIAKKALKTIEGRVRRSVFFLGLGIFGAGVVLRGGPAGL